MKKVAIVGVEGSGKTVMLAGLGKLMSQPDDNGYYLEPQDQTTVRYIRSQCEKLENGKWPASTPPDATYGLNWQLKKKISERGRSKPIARISCLDFAGEVYRAAFNAPLPGKGASPADVARLRRCIASADEVVVLVNLRDAISGVEGAVRAGETEFVVLQLLNYVLEDLTGPKSRVLLALSQSDMYSNTIATCGGPRKTIEKYLPTIMLKYGSLEVVAIHSVDKTTLNGNGEVVPARGCLPTGLRPMVDWLLRPRGVSDRIRAIRKCVQRHVVAWRLLGMLAMVVGVIGMVSIAFNSWLGNWDMEFWSHYGFYQSPPPPIPKSTWWNPFTWSPSQPPIPPKVEWVNPFDVPVFPDGWSWSLFFCVACGALATAGFFLCISEKREERANLTWLERFRIPLVLMVFLLSGLSTLFIRIWVAASSNEIYAGDTIHRHFLNKYMPLLLMGDWGYFFCCVASVSLALFFVFLTFRRMRDELMDILS